MTQPWHKRYHSDALSGFMSLTLEERGAYQTILDLLYDRGEPLADSDRMLAGYFNVSLRKARALVEILIEKDKLYRTFEGRLSNRRFEKEALSAQKAADFARNSGQIGGKKRARNFAENQKKSNKNREICQAPLQAIPEARSQKESPSLQRRASPPAQTREEPPDRAALGARSSPTLDLKAIRAACLEAVSPWGNLVALETASIAPVLGWLEAGADLHLDILPTLATKAARFGAPQGAQTIISWNFCRDAPIEAMRRRRIAEAPALPALTPVPAFEDHAYGLAPPQDRRGFRSGVQPSAIEQALFVNRTRHPELFLTREQRERQGFVPDPSDLPF